MGLIKYGDMKKAITSNAPITREELEKLPTGDLISLINRKKLTIGREKFIDMLVGMSFR